MCKNKKYISYKGLFKKKIKKADYLPICTCYSIQYTKVFIFQRTYNYNFLLKQPLFCGREPTDGVPKIRPASSS